MDKKELKLELELIHEKVCNVLNQIDEFDELNDQMLDIEFDLCVLIGVLNKKEKEEES